MDDKGIRSRSERKKIQRKCNNVPMSSISIELMRLQGEKESSGGKESKKGGPETSEPLGLGVVGGRERAILVIPLTAPAHAANHVLDLLHRPTEALGSATTTLGAMLLGRDVITSASSAWNQET